MSPTIWDIDEAERLRLNPWLDPAFNTCGVPLDEGMLPDDIPERIGLPMENVSIEINEVTGMTFLKLDDTPASYSGHNKKYVQVQGESLAFKEITIPTFDKESMVYLDRFRDNSIHWTWHQWKGASATGKSFTEREGCVEIAVTATTPANWSSADNTAPKLIIGTPGFPCEIICHLVNWSDNDDSRAGIFLSKTVSGTGSDASIFFHRVRDDSSSKDGLQVWRIGTGEEAYVAWPSNEVWFRIRLGTVAHCNSKMIFAYGSDGNSWTNLYTLPASTPASCQFPTSVPVLATGMFVQNWAATYAAVTGYFDHFEMIRSLGPDGG